MTTMKKIKDWQNNFRYTNTNPYNIIYSKQNWFRFID